MSEDWREKLRKLHNELRRGNPGGTKDPVPRERESRNSESSAKTVSKGAGIKPVPAIDAIVGIDFGTRFTKVALSLPHIDRRVVLNLGGTGGKISPTRVLLGDDGRLYSISCGGQTKPKLPIEYLKNRLADPTAGAFGASIMVERLPLARVIRPISAFYLAEILRKAEVAGRAAFPNELSPARRVNWSANVGVPTKHYDSELLDIFREVAAVAWMWRSTMVSAVRPDELAAEYEKIARVINPAEMPIQVAPELTAGLTHFAEHRNTPAGVYSFFDIGGGTLDGSAFRLRRERDGTSFDILSSNVQELGTMAVARNVVVRAYKSMVNEVERPIIFGGVSPEAKLGVPKQIEERIQTFFATIMRDAIGNGLLPKSEAPQRGIGLPPKLKMPVFVAGGGCQSEWYQHLFARTCEEYGHSAQWGIASYDVKIVPAPPHTVGEDYPRFVIALGLTSENLHFHQYRLPSRYSTVAGLPNRELSVPRYQDTKDLT